MSSHVPLEVGQALVDNDKRSIEASGGRRRGVIVEVEQYYAWVKWDRGGKTSRLERARIFAPTDRSRRTGYTLIP